MRRKTTNKNNQRVKQQRSNAAKQVSTTVVKPTPFKDVGGIVGKAINKFQNFINAEAIGKYLGSGIGNIFGSGDYTLTGPAPSYNVFMGSTQAPKFSTGKGTVISHREYLGDIQGTTPFTPTTYPLNPGIASTFPWLSTVASNYQEYRFHGLIFEFRPLITDFVTGGSPGVIVMSTVYNADAPVFASKQQMENSEYATSVKPTCGLMHAIECANNQTILPEKFVRTGAVPVGQDLRMYDLGNTVVATQLNPSQNLGEIWVSYNVEFFKPILNSAPNSDLIPSALVARSSTTSASPLGVVNVSTVGTLDLVVSATGLQWTAQPQQNYTLTIVWYGPGGTFLYPTINSLSGLAGNKIWFGRTSDNTTDTLAPAPTSATFNFSSICTNLNPGLVGISFTTATIPGGWKGDILVTAITQSIV